MDFESISLTARTQCLGEGSQIAYWHTNVQYPNASDEELLLWFVRVVLVQEPWQYVLCLSHCIGSSTEESRRSAKCECINIQAIIVIGFAGLRPCVCCHNCPLGLLVSFQILFLFVQQKPSRTGGRRGQNKHSKPKDTHAQS